MEAWRIALNSAIATYVSFRRANPEVASSVVALSAMLKESLNKKKKKGSLANHFFKNRLTT